MSARGSPRRSIRDTSPRSDTEYKSQDPSPRQIDDRFHTPRAQPPSARGASDSEFASPRMSARSGGGGSSSRGGGGSSARFAHSDNEFGTPRNTNSARSGYNSARAESKYDDGDESDRYLEGLSESKHTPYVHGHTQHYQQQQQQQPGEWQFPEFYLFFLSHSRSLSLSLSLSHTLSLAYPDSSPVPPGLSYLRLLEPATAAAAAGETRRSRRGAAMRSHPPIYPPICIPTIH